MIHLVRLLVGAVAIVLTAVVLGGPDALWMLAILVICTAGIGLVVLVPLAYGLGLVIMAIFSAMAGGNQRTGSPPATADQP